MHFRELNTIKCQWQHKVVTTFPKIPKSLAEIRRSWQKRLSFYIFTHIYILFTSILLFILDCGKLGLQQVESNWNSTSSGANYQNVSQKLLVLHKYVLFYRAKNLISWKQNSPIWNFGGTLFLTPLRPILQSATKMPPKGSWFLY